MFQFLTTLNFFQDKNLSCHNNLSQLFLTTFSLSQHTVAHNRLSQQAVSPGTTTSPLTTLFQNCLSQHSISHSTQSLTTVSRNTQSLPPQPFPLSQQSLTTVTPSSHYPTQHTFFQTLVSCIVLSARVKLALAPYT